MVKLGLTHKQMYPDSDKEKCCTPCCIEEDKLTYPEFYVSGKHAILMGLEDLKVGETVEVPVKIKVRSITKTDRDGKKEYNASLCIVGWGDMVEDSGGDDEASDDEVSAAEAVLEAPRDGWDS
jgi:hypothetical protein